MADSDRSEDLEQPDGAESSEPSGSFVGETAPQAPPTLADETEREGHYTLGMWARNHGCILGMSTGVEPT